VGNQSVPPAAAIDLRAHLRTDLPRQWVPELKGLQPIDEGLIDDVGILPIGHDETRLSKLQEERRLLERTCTSYA